MVSLSRLYIIAKRFRNSDLQSTYITVCNRLPCFVSGGVVNNLTSQTPEENQNAFQKLKASIPQRRGFTTQEGVGILLAGIFAVIFLYFVAYAVPGALTAIATTALTSVNGGVQTIFQVLFSIVAVFTFLLILVAVIQKVVS